MATIKFKNTYLMDGYSIIGPLEKKGKLKNYDEVMDDFYYEEKTFEQAEVKMQRKVLEGILKKHDLFYNDIKLGVGGDLYNQIAISSYNMKNKCIPFLGVYSACSTFTESIIVACKFLSKKLDNILVITSAHNLNAEKQFRYPIEYGAIRKKINTFTTTGAVATMVTNKKTNFVIESVTIGKVIDKDVKDVNNMGAVMAPACAQTIIDHLKDTNRDITYYDIVLTGDLGSVGSSILIEYLKYNGVKLKKHLDAGMDIYIDNDNVNAGGSGPACLPLVLFNKVLKNKKNKKILLVGTGSLHTKIFIDQKNSIPAISHAVSLEVL